MQRQGGDKNAGTRMVRRWLGRSDAAATVLADPVRLRRLQWRVFLAITLGYGMFYVCRLSLNVAKKPMIDQGLFDAAELGQIGSALFFMYAAGRLVNGAMADHAHVGRFMALGLCVSALAQLFLGTLPAFTILLVVWGLNGWAQSMGVPASVVAMSRWFAKKGRGSVYGVWSISHNIGEAFTFLVTAAVVASSQWRALRNTRLWWVALASASFYVTRYAVTSWGVFFLQESKGYSTVEAAAIVSSGALAGMVGTFSSGLIADRWFDGHRHRPALLFGLMYVTATALFLWGPADRLTDTLVDGRAHYDFSAAALLWVGAAVLAVVLAQCSAPRTVRGTQAK